MNNTEFVVDNILKPKIEWFCNDYTIFKKSKKNLKINTILFSCLLNKNNLNFHILWI